MDEVSTFIIDKFTFKKDEEFSNLHRNILETFSYKDKKNNLEIILVRSVSDPFNETYLFGTEIFFYLADNFINLI